MKIKIKKLLALMLAFMFLCMCVPWGLAASNSDINIPTFPDMPNDWSTEALQKALENGLLRGSDDGLLHPNSTLTRAEMAAIMNRASRFEIRNP